MRGDPPREIAKGHSSLEAALGFGGVGGEQVCGCQAWRGSKTTLDTGPRKLS